MSERYVRMYSSFAYDLVTAQEESIWRLGGKKPDGFGERRFFDYARHTMHGSHGLTRQARDSDTNLEVANVVSYQGVLYADTCIARVSRVVDDALLAFAGTVSIEIQTRSEITKTTLLDLLDRMPLRREFGEDVTAYARQYDADAALAYSIHAREKSPAPITVWIYLEGTIHPHGEVR